MNFTRYNIFFDTSNNFPIKNNEIYDILLHIAD
jgi:hypothetical protein